MSAVRLCELYLTPSRQSAMTVFCQWIARLGGGLPPRTPSLPRNSSTDNDLISSVLLWHTFRTAEGVLCVPLGLLKQFVVTCSCFLARHTRNVFPGRFFRSLPSYTFPFYLLPFLFSPRVKVWNLKIQLRDHLRKRYRFPQRERRTFYYQTRFPVYLERTACMLHLSPGTVYLQTLHFLILNTVLNANSRLSYSNSPPDWHSTSASVA